MVTTRTDDATVKMALCLTSLTSWRRMRE